jgi:serine/threonine protein kinase
MSWLKLAAMNPDLTTGAMVADYRIVGVIARGGMGLVYEARQVSNERRVALKVIAPELSGDVTFRERFEHESRVAIQLEHPFIDGVDLNHILASEGRLAPARALAVVDQIAAALDAAHRLGLVHRDVKPANVMVEKLGASREHCYVMDFGLAKHVASTGVTRTGNWVGTLDYVAPEQISGGRIDARTDVYSLGALLFHALTGEPPYSDRHDAAKVFAHVNSPPPSLAEACPELPRELSAVIARAMAKDPDRRYPSAGDLAHAAESGLAGNEPEGRERSVATGNAAPRPTVPYGNNQPRVDTAEPAATAPLGGGQNQARDAKARRRPRWTIGGGLVALVLVAGLLYLLTRPSSSRTPGAANGSTTHPKSGAARSHGQRTQTNTSTTSSHTASTTTTPSATQLPHGGGGTVSWAGEVGPLAFGASNASDVENTAGVPDATAEGSFELPNFPPYRALGYDCAGLQSLSRRSLTYGNSPPFCGTVYYINATNRLLEAFWSSSPRFKSLMNISPGTSVAAAASAERQKLIVGCGSPAFMEGGTGYAALVQLETVDAAASARNKGSFQILDIAAESNKHGIGLFAC